MEHVNGTTLYINNAGLSDEGIYAAKYGEHTAYALLNVHEG